MCRLLGFAAPGPVSADDVLGSLRTEQFAALSELHHDGWGTAWIDGRNAVGSYRDPRTARLDPEFKRAMVDAPTRARLVHLRWASDGMRVAAANTHPFVRDGIALVHNGYLGPGSRVESLLGDAAVAGLRGTTDSERYLALVWQCRAETDDLGTAVTRAAGLLREAFPHASLNALVMDAHSLVAVHASDAAVPPLADMWSDGYTPETLPADHLERYFRMRIRQGADGSVAIASSGLDAEGWEELLAESVTVVSLDTMNATTRPLMTDWAA